MFWNQNKALHAQPPRPVLRMSTCAQVPPGSSVPQPANDPASTTVLDRPSIAPTGCTPLLDARVLYASYMRKALANAYVSPTLKHLARRVPMHEHSSISSGLAPSPTNAIIARFRTYTRFRNYDSETTIGKLFRAIQKLIRAISKLRLGNYYVRFRNYD